MSNKYDKDDEGRTFEEGLIATKGMIDELMGRYPEEVKALLEKGSTPCLCIKSFLLARFTTEELLATSKVMGLVAAYLADEMDLVASTNPFKAIMEKMDSLARVNFAYSVVDHARIEVVRRGEEWNIESYS